MEKETPVSDYGVKFLAEMEAKYAALGAAIASVRAALNITGGLGVATENNLAPQIPGTPGGPISLPRGAFLGKKIPEAIKLFLSAARKTQANKEIAQALRDGGIKTKGNLDVIVTGALFNLKKNGVVLRFDDGWGLAEWYPESFRNQAQQEKPSGTKKRAKRKATKAKTGAKAPLNPQQPKGIGLDQQIIGVFDGDQAVVIDVDTMASFLNVNRGAVNLGMGRLRSKGKLGKTAEGYRLQGSNVQQMPKAV